jgi:hypothetical protein
MNSDTAQNPIADPEPQHQSNADPDPGTRPPNKKGFGDNKYDIFSILLSDCGRLYAFIFVKKSSYKILKTLDPDQLFDYGSGSRRKIKFPTHNPDPKRCPGRIQSSI